MEGPSATRRLRLLRDLNIDDMVQAAGLVSAVRWRPELRRLFDGPALLLARWLAEFDRSIETQGAGPAASQLLARLGQGVSHRGAAVLTQGPRLFVSNHPGLGDALALLAVLDQPGLAVVAREREVLRALHNFSRRLLVVPQTGAGRVLKLLEDHLNGGGAVLTFPAGRIEPDPAWFDPGPSWARWSRSTELLARRVEGLRVQPVLVSGVRLRAFVDPWAARWRRRYEDREWTAAVLQLAYQALFSRRHRLPPITVSVGEPLTEVTGAVLGSALAALSPLSR